MLTSEINFCISKWNCILMLCSTKTEHNLVKALLIENISIFARLIWGTYCVITASKTQKSISNLSSWVHYDLSIGFNLGPHSLNWQKISKKYFLKKVREKMVFYLTFSSIKHFYSTKKRNILEDLLSKIYMLSL